MQLPVRKNVLKLTEGPAHKRGSWPVRLAPVLRGQRSHCNEPMHLSEEQTLLAATRESLLSNKDPAQP